MKMTNFKLVQTIEVLDKYTNKRFPQKISYAIMKNAVALKQEYEIYSKQLQSLFKAYEDKSIKDDKGNVTYTENGIPLIQAKYEKAFTKELNELLNMEVEIDFYTVDSESFNYEESDRYDNLTPVEIMLLTSIMCNNKNK